jgi:hypothetical protein
MLHLWDRPLARRWATLTGSFYSDAKKVFFWLAWTVERMIAFPHGPADFGS